MTVTRISPSVLCPECGTEKPTSWRECSPECELYRTRRELSRALALLQSKTEEVQTLKFELERLKGR